MKKGLNENDNRGKFLNIFRKEENCPSQSFSKNNETFKGDRIVKPWLKKNR